MPRHCLPVRLLLCLLLGTQLAIPLLAEVKFTVNEVLASNALGLRDENGDTPDWIELHNAGDEEGFLSGWGLSDDPKRPFKWIFQQGSIPPGGYLLVHASGKNRQPSAPTPLDPASIPGLALWLRTDSINPNDASLVRKSGTSVYLRRWLDSSGGQNHATTANDAVQPLWIRDGAGGRGSLRFDGSNDQLLLSRVSATNHFTLIVVARATRPHEAETESDNGVGGTSGQRYLFGAWHGGDFNAGSGVSMGTNGVAVIEHGSGYMPALASYSGALGDTFHVLAIRYDRKQPSLFIDGLLARVGVVSPRSLVTSPVEIGAGAYGAFAGEIAEVLIYQRSLNDLELAGVGQSLSSRFAIPFSRPLHTNFQLSSAGEEVVLTSPNRSSRHSLKFGPQFQDVSYGLQPEGSDTALFFSNPTPGTANVGPGAVEWLDAPTFSNPSGFYTTNFNLTLHSPDPEAEIRYTLDGSEPTHSSPRYSAAILIRSRVGSGNQLSAIPTVPGGPVANGEVFKGWVVRARAFKDRALPSRIATQSFWVDPKGRARYSVPVVSLITDRRHFFSAETGIYVPGLSLNYNQRGPEWERPIHVELCEPDNSVPVSQPADVKIHGNTSQNFPIKGLDLDATGLHGGKPFRYRFFPNRSRNEFEHILLRPTGHDQQMTFMRDEFMQSLASESGAESQADRLCVVFINGEYWGLHYLKEKEDVEFVAHYAGLAESEVDFLEGYVAAKAGDTQHYDQLIQVVGSQNLLSPGIYESIESRMEIPNYIDYKAFEIFYYRWDIGNHRLWRPRTPEGRWRWLQFDNDVGWGGFWAVQPSYSYNMLEAVLSTDGRLNGHNGEVTTFLLRRLVTHPSFRQEFINRTADLMNTILHPSNTTQRILAYAAQLEPEMAEHTRRWRAPSSLAEWKSLVQGSLTFANQRPTFVRQHFQTQFKLGAPASVQLSVSNPNSGAIQLNSLLRRDPADQPFSGIYFRKQPVRIEAKPSPGHRFVHWLGLPIATNNPHVFTLEAPVQIHAVFEPIPTIAPRIQLTAPLPDGRWPLFVEGTANTTYSVEHSTDLLNWLPIAQLSLDAAGTASFSLPAIPPSTTAFFRLVGITFPANP